jgi:hypothetical protein
MNPIESLKNESNKENEIYKNSFLYKIRKNNILNWVYDLEEIIKYKDILNTCNFNSTLEIESGIVKINPIGRYLSHKFVDHVKRGFNFYELCIVMKHKIISFESYYGMFNLSEEDIEKVKQIIYKYNRLVFDKLDINDKKKLIHIEQTAEVLHYMLVPSVILENIENGWCSLTFTVDNNKKKDYCTIFSVEELELLEKVNKLIQK